MSLLRQKLSVTVPTLFKTLTSSSKLLPFSLAIVLAAKGNAEHLYYAVVL